MKGITRFKIYLAITVMILTAALAIPAAAQKQVPFKGELQGNDLDTRLSPTTVLVTTTGTGTATHLGNFSFTLKNTVNLVARTGTGFAHFIAANGDTIDATTVGSGHPTGTPGIIKITEIYTITGGTGRFEGAQGSFVVERLGNGITFTTFGSFDGTITSPGTADEEGDED